MSDVSLGKSNAARCAQMMEHISKYYPISKPVSKQRGIELARRAKAGCNESKQALLASYMPAIARVGCCYSSPGFSVADWVQEGVVAACDCLTRFDPDMNMSFSTYLFTGLRFHYGKLVNRTMVGYGIKTPTRHYSNDTRINEEILKSSEFISRDATPNEQDPTMGPWEGYMKDENATDWDEVDLEIDLERFGGLDMVRHVASLVET